MSFGTVAFDKKVYNLDFMSKEEVNELVKNIEKEKIKKKKELKKGVR